MYNVALSVAACLRAGTRVDVAWIASSTDFTFDPAVDAVALTPGGGRIGGALGGAFDGRLAELAQQGVSRGRVADLTVTDAEAAVAGLPRGGTVRWLFVPATALPEQLWPLLLEREPVCLVCTVEDAEITATDLYTTDRIGDADEAVAAVFGQDGSATSTVGDALVTVLRPVPRLVVTGGGPIAAALEANAALLGWQVTVEPDTQAAIGLVAGLSPIDGVVVMGHDVESSSRVLAAALESTTGYIGALGSLEMQRNRADWLAYRGVNHLGRVDGPAGVDIGADTPAEIAVSILAAAIGTHRGRTS